MPADVQETLFEGPIPGELVPAVVFLFPAVMTELANQLGRKRLAVRCGHPEPFLLGGLELELALAEVILGKRTTRTGCG